MRIHLSFVIGLCLFLSSGPSSAETLSPWGNCPGFYDVEHSIPGWEDCPPPERMVWIDCPAVWPKDGHTSLSYGFSYSNFSLDHDAFDISRQKLDRFPNSTQLICEYENGQRHQLIIEILSPIVQCGYHGSSHGEIMGCRRLKTDADQPEPITHFPETISDRTTLAGVGLGWTVKRLKDFAERKGVTLVQTEGGIYKVGSTLEVLFDAKTQISKEVILKSGMQDEDVAEMHRRAVRQFGFHWDIHGAKRMEDYSLIGGEKKEHWLSPDHRIGVIYWPDQRPKEGSSLRLLYWPKE